MSKFDVNDGPDRLIQDIQKLGELSTDDHWEILTPAADLLVKKFAQKVKQVFTQYTGKLAEAIQGFRKSGGGDGHYILVYPHGPHHKYKSRTKKTKKGAAASKTAAANEVAFVLEYGSPGRNIKATHWMENALEESSAEISDALQQGFDDYCDKRGIGQ